jgi:hypothetical protein
MTIITPPAWQQAGTYAARTDRLSVISGLLGYHGASADESSALRTRGGVRPSYQGRELLVAAQLTPNMTVQVSAGFCYVQNKDLSGYGAYTVVNDATVNLTIAASSGSQYRKDTIVVQVLDAETLGIVNSASLVVVQGPYAASAGATTRGTIPPNSIILADVAVDAGVSSIAAGKVTDGRQFQVAAGGILPVLSTALLDHPGPGQVMYATDTDVFLYGTAAGATKQFPFSGSTAVGSWQDSYLAADATPLVSNTVLTASGLSLPVVANAMYELEGFLEYNGAGSSIGDLKVDWTVPAAATLRWAPWAATPGGNANALDTLVKQNGTTYALGVFGTSAPVAANLRGRIITGANAGTATMLIAQQTSSATATTLKAGSWLRTRRIA